MFNFLKKYRYKFTFGVDSSWIIEAKNESCAVQKFLYEHPWHGGNFIIEEV